MWLLTATKSIKREGNLLNNLIIRNNSGLLLQDEEENESAFLPQIAWGFDKLFFHKYFLKN